MQAGLREMMIYEKQTDVLVSGWIYVRSLGTLLSA